MRGGSVMTVISAWPVAPEDERGVVPAEPKRVRHHRFEGGRASDVGHVIEVAIGVWRLVVRGGWNDAVLQGHDADAGFDRAGRTEQMPSHRLRGADRQLVGVLAEHAL